MPDALNSKQSPFQELPAPMSRSDTSISGFLLSLGGSFLGPTAEYSDVVVVGSPRDYCPKRARVLLTYSNYYSTPKRLKVTYSTAKFSYCHSDHGGA